MQQAVVEMLYGSARFVAPAVRSLASSLMRSIVPRCVNAAIAEFCNIQNKIIKRNTKKSSNKAVQKRKSRLLMLKGMDEVDEADIAGRLANHVSLYL